MSELPAILQDAIGIVEDECFLNDFSPVEKTKSRKTLWRVGNIIRDRIKASAAARCSAVSAEPELLKHWQRVADKLQNDLRTHAGFETRASRLAASTFANVRQKTEDALRTEPQTASAREAILMQALETAAGRFNMMAGVGLVNGADPKVGYRECMDALKSVRSQAVNAPAISSHQLGQVE